MASRRLLATVLVSAAGLVAPGPARATEADEVVAEVRAHTARYLDLAHARAEGFVQVTDMQARHGYHFLDARSPLLRGVAGATGRLDLARPSMLIYVERDGAWQLTGVEYALPARPAGGPLPRAAWREHAASCHYRDFHELAASRPRDCPARHPASGAPFVLWHPALAVAHVWAWYPNPAGPFAEDNAYLAPYGGGAAEHIPGAHSPAEALYSTITHRAAGAMLIVLAAVGVWETARRRRFPWNAVSAPLWVGFGIYLFFSSDPESWPWGPGRFTEIFQDTLVLQHKTLALLPILIGAMGVLRGLGTLSGAARYAVPVLATVGGLSLFVHFHDGRFHLDAIYLQHAVMGTTGVGLGVVLLAATRSERARAWLGWAWPGFLLLMATVLLLYTER